jgi:hypothetical protein
MNSSERASHFFRNWIQVARNAPHIRSTAVDLHADQTVAGNIQLVRLYGDPSNLSAGGLKTRHLVHRGIRQRIHPLSPAHGIVSNYVKHNHMKASTTQVKRKIGRPSEIGADKFVGLRLPGGLVNRVGTWAKQSRVVSRSEAIRLLLEKGLEQEGDLENWPGFSRRKLKLEERRCSP